MQSLLFGFERGNAFADRTELIFISRYSLFDARHSHQLDFQLLAYIQRANFLRQRFQLVGDDDKRFGQRLRVNGGSCFRLITRFLLSGLFGFLIFVLKINDVGYCGGFLTGRFGLDDSCANARLAQTTRDKNESKQILRYCINLQSRFPASSL